MYPSHGFGFGVTTQILSLGQGSDIVTNIVYSVGVTDAIVQESIT